MKRIRIFIVFGAGILLSWQCVDLPVDPKIPTWDVELSVPLINRSYMLEELVEKNPDIISIDGNGILVYSFSDTVVYDSRGHSILLNPEPSSFYFEAGMFAVDLPDIEHSLPLAEYIMLPPGTRGNSLGIEETGVSGSMPEIPDIDYVTIGNGTLTLEMVNNSGLPVEIGDGVRIRNSDTGSDVATFHLQGVIEPGSVVRDEVYVADKRVYRHLEFEFIFRSPRADNVDVPENPSLDFSLEFSDLSVSGAHARIPRQNIDGGYDGGMKVDDVFSFREVFFSGGTLDITIENSLDVDLPVTVIFPDLYARADPSVSYTRGVCIERLGEYQLQVDLRQWILRSQTGVLRDELRYGISLGAIAETDDYRTVNHDDIISGEVVPGRGGNEIVIQSITGILRPEKYKMEERHIEVDFGEVADIFEGDVTFGDASLSMEFFFEGEYDVDLDLHIIGTNSRGIRDSVALPYDQRRIIGGEWSVLTLNKSNSTVNDFLGSFVPHFPEEFFLSGDILVNPDRQDGRYDADDKLTGILRLDIPFNFGIQGGIVRDTLLIGDSGDDDIDREVFDYFNGGQLFFESVNGIPVDMEIILNLMDREGRMLRSFPLEGQPPIGVSAAKISPAGTVTEPPETEVRVLQLGRDDMRVFREADLAEIQLLVSTAEEEIVIFKADDYVEIRIYAVLDIRADFN